MRRRDDLAVVDDEAARAVRVGVGGRRRVGALPRPELPDGVRLGVVECVSGGRRARRHRGPHLHVERRHLHLQLDALHLGAGHGGTVG